MEKKVLKELYVFFIPLNEDLFDEDLSDEDLSEFSGISVGFADPEEALNFLERAPFAEFIGLVPFPDFLFDFVISETARVLKILDIIESVSRGKEKKS